MQELVGAFREYFGDTLQSIRVERKSPGLRGTNSHFWALTLVVRVSNPAIENLDSVVTIDFGTANEMTFGTLSPQTLSCHNEFSMSGREFVTMANYYLPDDCVGEIITSIERKAWDKWNKVISTQIDRTVND